MIARTCYRCSKLALWHVLLGNENEPPVEAVACEDHAREHMREPLQSDWGLPHATGHEHFEHVPR